MMRCLSLPSQPKTFFANERTFLQWTNIGVLLMFVSLSMLTSSAALASTSSSSSSSSDAAGEKGFMGICAPGAVACIASLVSQPSPGCREAYCSSRGSTWDAQLTRCCMTHWPQVLSA
jgi:hypothetical protein